MHGKNRVCIILMSLKVDIWFDHHYTSTQAELSYAIFILISLNSARE